MNPRVELGKQVEDRAAEWFLRRAGSPVPARLLARNYRCKAGEIDLVFEEGRDLVFVEVRARLAGSLESGLESVGFRKRQRLRRAIGRFLMSYRGGAQNVRVDILAWDGQAWVHLENARMDS